MILGVNINQDCSIYAHLLYRLLQHVNVDLVKKSPTFLGINLQLHLLFCEVCINNSNNNFVYAWSHQLDLQPEAPFHVALGCLEQAS